MYVYDGDSIYAPLVAVFRWVCFLQQTKAGFFFFRLFGAKYPYKYDEPSS